MKVFTIFFLAVAIFCVPTFSNASIPSNVVSMNEASYYEMDQAQEAMEEFVKRGRPHFQNVQNADDLYSRIVKELKELKKLAEFLDIEETGILIPAEDVPEEIRLDLEAIAKSQELVCIELVVMYSDDPVGYMITSEALSEMTDERWSEICKLYGFTQKKSDFMANAQKAFYYSFTLVH